MSESLNISQIFDKPGKDWPKEERDEVFHWLLEQQHGYLLHFCLYHLGYLGKHQDAEDVWSEFCDRRLFGVINSYDPLKGRRFWNYLLMCLEQECWRMKKKIEIEEGMKVPIEVQKPTEAGEFNIVTLPPYVENPTSELELQDFIQRLNKCLEKLPSNWRTAFQLVVLQEMSYEEASSILKERVGTIRVYICRAKKVLRECLANQGKGRENHKISNFIE